MPSLKEIKGRIASVNSTRKITSAMKMVASSKLPFGGVEQLCWSPDSRQIAYTCRKKVGKAYAISTDSDIYLYDLATASTRNLCKPS